MSAKKATVSTASKKTAKKTTTTRKKKIETKPEAEEASEVLFGGMKPLIEESTKEVATEVKEAIEVKPQVASEDLIVLDEAYADAESMQNMQSSQPEIQSSLTLTLSDSLVRKLKQKAQQEGVKLNDFVTELIAEGLVLRAWEIMERKNTMRSGAAPTGGKFSNNNLKNPNQNRANAPFRPNNNNHKNNNRPPHNNSNNNNRRNVNYNAIMGEKDNTSFLEYVRNQEKKLNR